MIGTAGKSAAAISLLLGISASAHAWGVRGHRVTHALAATALRTEGTERSPAARRAADLVGANAEFFRTQADLPDRVRGVRREEEEANHFLDLEEFGRLSFLRDLPATRPEAVPDSAGRLPWTLGEAALAFRKALRDGDPAGALLLATRIGHYVGDAHVPLHSTVFYDGRDTEEEGIHARWESRTVASMEGLDSLVPLPRAGLPHRAPDRPLDDSELVRWVQVLSAGTLAASHRLLVGVYGADADARRADPSRGETYLAVMRREEGRTIRRRLGLAGRAIAEVLFAAADDPETDPLAAASGGEMRLDHLGTETGAGGAVFRLEVRRLGPPRSGAGEATITARFTSERRGFRSRATRGADPFTPPAAIGETREILFAVPWSELRGVAEIEFRLDPSDRLSPEDNLERVRRRAWGEEPGAPPREPRRRRRG